MFLENDSFISKDRQCRICVLALCLLQISCKKITYFLFIIVSGCYGIQNRGFAKYCEKYFIIIITDITHLSTSLTFPSKLVKNQINMSIYPWNLIYFGTFLWYVSISMIWYSGTVHGPFVFPLVYLPREHIRYSQSLFLKLWRKINGQRKFQNSMWWYN